MSLSQLASLGSAMPAFTFGRRFHDHLCDHFSRVKNERFTIYAI